MNEINEPNGTTWDQRPRNLKSEELNAWALTTITDALTNITYSLNGIQSALHLLGTGDAATTMGAIEFLASQIKEGLNSLATSADMIALNKK